MKIQGSFSRMQTLAKMTRAALKIWQFVARYTTKPLLCQGVEGDMAMAKNSRRVFADAKTPAMKDEGRHIAFDDNDKLITPEKTAALYTHAPRVQVVALANWESAPTFVLDKHLGQGFPKSDDDITSESPTVSTDCSTIQENHVEDHELDMAEKEVDAVHKQDSVALNEQTVDIAGVNVEPVVNERKPSVADRMKSNTSAQLPEAELKKRAVRWICVGHGRYVKHEVEQTREASPVQNSETPWTVQVGYGQYSKYFVNGERGRKLQRTEPEK